MFNFITVEQHISKGVQAMMDGNRHLIPCGWIKDDEISAKLRGEQQVNLFTGHDNKEKIGDENIKIAVAFNDVTYREKEMIGVAKRE